MMWANNIAWEFYHIINVNSSGLWCSCHPRHSYHLCHAVGSQDAESSASYLFWTSLSSHLDSDDLPNQIHQPLLLERQLHCRFDTKTVLNKLVTRLLVQDLPFWNSSDPVGNQTMNDAEWLGLKKSSDLPQLLNGYIGNSNAWDLFYLMQFLY